MSPSFSPPISHFLSDARSISSRFLLRRKSGAHRLEIGPLLGVLLTYFGYFSPRARMSAFMTCHL